MLLPKIERRFRELAARQEKSKAVDHDLEKLRAELAQVQTQLKTVAGNMALAKTPQQFEAISSTFDQLTAQETSLRAGITDAESRTKQAPDSEAEVAGAMGVIHRLTDLITGPNRSSATRWKPARSLP